MCAVRDIFLSSAAPEGPRKSPLAVGGQVSLSLRPTCVGRGRSADCPPGDTQPGFPESTGSSVLSDLEVCFTVGHCPVFCVYLTISSLFPTFSVLPTSLLFYFIPQKIAEKSRALLPTAQRGGKQQVGAEGLLWSVGVSGQHRIHALGTPGKGREDTRSYSIAQRVIFYS